MSKVKKKKYNDYTTKTLKKEIQILKQISEFCKNECQSSNCCYEDGCVLYRIEKIIGEEKR